MSIVLIVILVIAARILAVCQRIASR